MAAGYAERFVFAPDGLRLYVRDYTGDKAAIPVFCLHGLTRNSADFEGVATYLAQLGRRVLAMDVRGRGRSDRDPDFSHYRPDVYARDVLCVFDALSVKQAIFIGTSMGGLITMLLASLAPERIHAVVLNDVGPVVNPAGLARIAGYVGNIGPFEFVERVCRALSTQRKAPSFPIRTTRSGQPLRIAWAANCPTVE